MTATTRLARPQLALAGPRLSQALGVALVTLAAVVLIVAVASTTLLIYGATHGPMIYPGVRSAGVELGSLAPHEAEIAIAQRIEDLGLQTLTLEADGRRWTIPVSELGVTFDARRTAADAYKAGRSGSLWHDSQLWLRGLAGGYDVPVAYTLDQQALTAALERIAPEIVRFPRDAEYAVDPAGGVAVLDGEAGLGIDVTATVGQIQRRLAALSPAPITISMAPVEPRITAGMLAGAREQATIIAGEPLTIVHGAHEWRIGPESLVEMLRVDVDGSGRASVQVDVERLAAALGSLAEQINHPGSNAGVMVEDGVFRVIPSVPGASLDLEATVSAAAAALLRGERRVAVATRPLPAAVSDAEAERAIAIAAAMLERPVRVTWEGGAAELGRDALAGAIRFVEGRDGASGLSVDVDAAALEAVLAGRRAQVERPAVDADLRYFNGRVVVARPEKAGVALDLAASAARVRDAILSGRGEVALATAPVEPKITAAMAGEIVVRDLLGSGQTSYAGSVPNRRHNVELAVERANGALVPPGGIYSFIGTIGDVDLESGYKVGYGIVGASNGTVMTVPSVGGGICQVSTTVFHAAFWAGLPIVERNWHFYWIPLYGQQPSGLIGLDSTVDTDVGLDFKFRNTTDHWIAVVATADGQNVRFELWGVDPGWTVEVGQPVVTNVVPADQTMQYRETDQLAAGTTAFVERAHDGFNVSIHRRVHRDGQTLDDLTLTSSYVPSRNVTLVGTR